MRNAVNQASSAFGNAQNEAATLGNEAQGIGANLTPFLTSEMLHPQGVGQAGLSAETSAALGGAGGEEAGLTGKAMQRAAASRNAGGFQASLADVAREREKAAAGSSENIAAQNERLKQQQVQEGATGLEHMYGVDTSGMLGASGQEAQDINAETNAAKTGWLQNSLAIINALKPGYSRSGGFSAGG